MRSKPSLVLVTPAHAADHNGHATTAARWARLLADDFAVRVAAAWDGAPADAMVGLHARHCAPSIAAWAEHCPGRPLALVLTGTDLYRDLPADAATQRSVELAQRLIVLNERAPDDVPPAQRAKVVVCFPSASARRALPKARRHLRALMVGSLCAEQDPATYFAAARKLVDREDIYLDHVGAPLDASLGAAASALMREQPRYRWLGALPHEATRRRIQRAHLLVQPGTRGGGAHVVMEAVRSGTPVLASRIPGNEGLLGRDYRGYFAPGDASGLALLLQRARADAAMLARLRAQCDRRAPLFDAARERATLRRVLAELMEEASR